MKIHQESIILAAIYPIYHSYTTCWNGGLSHCIPHHLLSLWDGRVIELESATSSFTQIDRIYSFSAYDDVEHNTLEYSIDGVATSL